MCRRAECSTCGKPTFTGCGAHVEQVLGDVAPADRCRCHETAKNENEQPREPEAKRAEKRR